MVHILPTAWKVSKYGVFSGPYFPAFGLNTGKYGPEKTPYLDSFHTVSKTVLSFLEEFYNAGWNLALGNLYLSPELLQILSENKTDSPLCLGSISKDWSVDNMKKIGFTGYVSDFSVDYDAIAAGDILDIHNYLMKKNNIV